jgi:predicted RNase H-like HicB family nuclease
MGIIKILGRNGKKAHARDYQFTVVVLPVYDVEDRPTARRASQPGKTLRRRNPIQEPVGYQSTVPVLPGLITFGRTPEEAREMAQDAIRVHLEGLKKSGEPIPDEREAQIEPVRIRVSA